MYFDVTTARLEGIYEEERIYANSNGRATVNCRSETLSIIFISANDIGNVMQPAIDGTVFVNDNGEIDVGLSDSVLPTGSNKGPGSRFLGEATRYSLAWSLVMGLAILLL